jgi:Na+-driven multidrug efflux pump
MDSQLFSTGQPETPGIEPSPDLSTPLTPPDDPLPDPLPGPPPDPKKGDEHERLGGHPPLITLLRLSAGPLLAQGVSAIVGIVHTIWVSQYLGEIAMTAISTYSAFDGMGRAFGFFVSTAGASQISALFGSGHGEEASQVVMDLVRVCLIFGLLIPAILVPTCRPLARWIGATEDVVDLGWTYMLPILICSFGTCLFLGAGGCLQGEGRSFLFAMTNLVALIASAAVLDPLFLIGFKAGIISPSLATDISETVPGILLFVLYVNGKFSVKPELKQLFRKFSPRTMGALRIGISQLIANLSVLIPSLIIRKLIGNSCGPQSFNDALAAYNIMVRVMIFTNNTMLGCCQGFIPAASYAYAGENFRRYLWLAWHCFWTTGLWGSFTCVLTWTIPRSIGRLFSDGEGFLDWTEAFLRISNALGFIVNGRFVGVAMLQSLQMGVTSTIVSLIAHFLSLLGFALLLYYTARTDAKRIIWAYSLSYVVGFLMASGVLAKPLWKMKKAISSEAATNPVELQDIEVPMLDTEAQRVDVHQRDLAG